jgi:capsular polysaccharide biosynthesis protein
MIVAIGWVLFSESLDPRVRTMRDLDDEPGVPVLGAIPTLRYSRRTTGT